MAPFPEAMVHEFAGKTHRYRWFEGFKLPDDLYPFVSPCAPRGIQTWVAELWDQHAVDEEGVFCIYGQTDLPPFTSLEQERRETAQQEEEAARGTPQKRKFEETGGDGQHRKGKRGLTRSPAPAPLTGAAAVAAFARNLANGGNEKFEENLNQLMLSLSSLLPGGKLPEGYTTREWLDFVSEMIGVIPDIELNPLAGSQQPLLELFLQLAAAVAPISRDGANLFTRLANGVLKDVDLQSIIQIFTAGSGRPSDADRRKEERDKDGAGQGPEGEGGGEEEGEKPEEEGDGGGEQQRKGGEERGGEAHKKTPPPASPQHKPQDSDDRPQGLPTESRSLEPRNLRGFRSPSPRRAHSRSSTDRHGRSLSRSSSRGHSSSPSGSPPRRTIRSRSASPSPTSPAKTAAPAHQTDGNRRYSFDAEESEQVCYSESEADDFADLASDGEGTETPALPESGPDLEGETLPPAPDKDKPVAAGKRPSARERLTPQVSTEGKKSVKDRLTQTADRGKAPVTERLGPLHRDTPVRERLGPQKHDAASQSPRPEPPNRNPVKDRLGPRPPSPDPGGEVTSPLRTTTPLREHLGPSSAPKPSAFDRLYNGPATARGKRSRFDEIPADLTVVDVIRTEHQLQAQVQQAEQTKKALELSVKALRGVTNAGAPKECAALEQKAREIEELRSQIELAKQTKMAVARRETEKIHGEVAEYMAEVQGTKRSASLSPGQQRSKRFAAQRRPEPPSRGAKSLGRRGDAHYTKT